MISEFFLNIIFALVSGMLTMLPEITWSVNAAAFEPFLNIIRVAGYMLPMDTVIAIVLLVFNFTLVRIVISIVKSIWDLLPLV